jgi:phosphopantetheinyl transferase
MLYRIFDDMNQCSEQAIARLLPLVSAQRREQALRYQHTFGQFCCLQSYIMLIQLLAEWGRVQQVPVNEQPIFLYNEYGAPFIEGGPYFSISHCKVGMAVAVSENPIGIDIAGIPVAGDIAKLGDITFALSKVVILFLVVGYASTSTPYLSICFTTYSLYSKCLVL